MKKGSGMGQPVSREDLEFRVTLCEENLKNAVMSLLDPAVTDKQREWVREQVVVSAVEFVKAKADLERGAMMDSAS